MWPKFNTVLPKAFPNTLIARPAIIIDTNLAEKVTNGAFAGTPPAPGWTYAEGVDFTTAYQYALFIQKKHTLSPMSQTVTLVKGARYLLKYFINDGVNGSIVGLSMQCSVGSYNLPTLNYSSVAQGAYSEYFIAPATSCLLQFLVSTVASNFSWTGFGAVSIKSAP